MIDADMQRFYNQGRERERLTRGAGTLAGLWAMAQATQRGRRISCGSRGSPRANPACSA